MNSVGVFYHCYIPNTFDSSLWHILIDEQLGIVEQSGLSKVAEINMCITMPMYWKIEYTQDKKLFHQYVREYIETRYSFVNILEVRDTAEPNLFEGQTLRRLYRYCKTNSGGSVLYFHTKGITVNRLETKLWRQILDKIMVDQWQQRYLELKDTDCLGVSYRNMDSDKPLLSGNYFWAKNDYISTLDEPISNDRYYYEHWIHENNPKIKFALDLGDKNMYDDIHIYGKLT